MVNAGLAYFGSKLTPLINNYTCKSVILKMNNGQLNIIMNECKYYVTDILINNKDTLSTAHSSPINNVSIEQEHEIGHSSAVNNTCMHSV